MEVDLTAFDHVFVNTESFSIPKIIKFLILSVGKKIIVFILYFVKILEEMLELHKAGAKNRLVFSEVK